jgi:nucleoside-diphosphate-sugar epimerase
VVTDRRLPGAYDEVAAHGWDVVLDVSWQPEQVRSALSALASRARHWVYVSSISVYANQSVPGLDESATLVDPWSGSGEASIEEYAGAKVSCETSCLSAVGEGRLLIARAGLIVGYGDRSDRFGYWPARFARAHDAEHLLVPPADCPVQVIDVVDLARWLVDAAEGRVAGTFDATGPQLTFADVAAACESVTGVSPALVEPRETWLVDAEVAPWAGPDSLPLWLPREDYGGMAARKARAVRGAGLRSRPLTDTVRDSLRWERELGLDRERRAGLSRGKEADLLRRWQS